MAKSKPKSKANAQSEFSQPKKRRPFTVYLIVDDQSTRQSMGAMLKKEKIDVLDYMTPMDMACENPEPGPGVVVADVRLRGDTGPGFADSIEQHKKNVLIILIANHVDAAICIEAMQKNVLDFLLRPVSAQSLFKAVARAYAQYYDVDWDFVGEDLEYIEDSLSRITAREREVLDMLVDGNSSREIGKQLGVSTKTIEAHRARINDKMRFDDLAHLVRMVLASRNA